MKKIVSIIFFVSLFSVGQNNKEESLSLKDSLIGNLRNSFLDAAYKNPDSALRLLKISLPQYKNDALIKAWKNHLKGTFFYGQQNADSALFYYNKVFETVTPEADPFLFNETKILSGMVYKNIGQLPKALEKLKEAEKQLFTLEKVKPVLKINLFRALGAYYTDVPEYEKGITYYLKALKLLEKEKGQEKSLANVNLNLAEIFLKIKDYGKAKKYLFAAKNICEKIGYDFGTHTCELKLADIALSTNTVKNYDVQKLKDALAFFESLQIYPRIIEARYNLSRIYNLNNQPEKEKVELLKILELSEKINYSLGLINASQNLGILEEKQSNYPKALEYYLFALKYANDTENGSLKMSLNNSIAGIYKKRNDYKNAFSYLEKANTLNDSLNKVEQIKNVQELETKYQTEKKEKEIALLIAENKLSQQQKRNQRYLLLGILAIIAIVGIFVFFQLRNRQKTNKKLKELDKAKSTFFANISHEFRTPLTLINGPLEDQLVSKNISSSERKNLNTALRNTQRLKDLVDQLLALSKLESKNLKLKVQQSNMPQFLLAQAEAFSFNCSEKNIDYKIEIEKDEIVDWFDQDVIEKIVYNLIGNAIKYTSENGKILISGTRKNHKYELTVHNSGNYISQEQHEKIFERFYQSNHKNPGTGIGLALTKDLTELHHGAISLKSEKEGFTEFSVEIPTNKEEFTVDEIFSEEITKEENVSTNEVFEIQKTIVAPEDAPVLLIVDDNEDIREYVSSVFETTYIVHSAKDGKDGFENALENIPDIVISDVMMPEEDGFSLTKKLKEHQLTSHIPVILLTAKTQVTSKLEGMGIGADAYVTKPFNPQLLKANVDNLIENRRKLQQRFSQEVILMPKDIAVSSADEQFLDRLQKVLDQNLTEPDFSAEIFGAEMGVSRMQLHRKLKGLTGQSTTEFIRSQRLKLAVKLLRENKISISEVGYTVGFNDPSYFTRCFKQEFGFAPSEYLSK